MSQMPALQHPDPPRFRALEALGLTAQLTGSTFTEVADVRIRTLGVPAS
jgi:hypothetical protein